MPKANKGLTIGLVAISVIATFAAVTFFMGRQAEQAKRVWAESQLEEMLRLKSALEREKEELTKARDELTAKVQELEGKVTSLTDEAKQLADTVASEKRAAQAALEELSAAKRQAEESRTRLEAERRGKLTLADDLAKAKQEAKHLQEELTQLRQAKEALERRVKEVMAGEEGAPDTIVVTPTAPTKEAPAAKAAAQAPMAKPGEGNVLVVNREFNFIVVNLGERDGVKPGQFLEVMRGGRPIARVQVERVYENMAAANILPETKREDIKEGDQARRA